jgi:hypothetical protein
VSNRNLNNSNVKSKFSVNAKSVKSKFSVSAKSKFSVNKRNLNNGNLKKRKRKTEKKVIDRQNPVMRQNLKTLHLSH